MRPPAPRALRCGASGLLRRACSGAIVPPGTPRQVRPAACAAATATTASAPTTSLGTQPSQAPRSAYVHLPFCKRRCHYCDFPVEPVGGSPGGERVARRMAAYVDTLLLEVASTAVLGDPASVPLETVYLGGGTPSLVPPALLARVLAALRGRFGMADGAEATIEADPGTFDAATLAEYRRLGFTRLSIGVQAFDADLLRACGRAHSLADARAALAAAAASGFPSWSLDMMSGLPGLTRAGWRAALAEAAASGAPHISVYDLQVEEGTPFARRYLPGAAPLPSDDDAAGMYADAAALLGAAGYEHYEVSSYARPGHRSRHNQVYWRCAPYYAFGLGAASYLGGRRFTRPRAAAAYEAWAAGLAARAAAGGGGGSGGGALPGAEVMPETQEERLLDYVMLGLRTSDGLDLARLEAEHGAAAAAKVLAVLRRHAAAGLVELRPAPAACAGGSRGGGPGATEAAAEGGPLGVSSARLTDPDGFLVSNNVISDVFAAL